MPFVSGRVLAASQKRLRVGSLEAHVDGRRGLVLILDLGLGQRRTAIGAPVHRFVAALQVAVGDDAAKGAHDVGLVAEIHGEIGMLPVAEHAQPDEIDALAFHLGARVFAAGLAELVGRHLAAGLADFLFHRQLDRQTVAIPAGHEGNVEAIQQLGLDDNVLEDLVDGVTDVNVAVGVRRTVVQDVLRPSGARLAHATIEVRLLPIFQRLGLARGQVGLHRKIRARKVQGVLVIVFGHNFTPGVMH